MAPLEKLPCEELCSEQSSSLPAKKKKHSRPWSNCVKVRPKLAQPTSKAYLKPGLEPLVVSTGFVERLQPSNDAVKGGEPLVETFVHMFVRSGRSSSGVDFQLVEKIGAIRACFHRNGEDPLDHEIVEGLQGDVVGLAERRREFLRRVRLGVLERLAGKGQTAKEPEQSLRRLPLLLALLVFHQLFEGVGQRRRHLVSRADFRDIALQVGLDDGECGRAKEIEKANDALRSLQEGEGVDARVGNGDICEGGDGVKVRGHVELADVLVKPMGGFGCVWDSLL